MKNSKLFLLALILTACSSKGEYRVKNVDNGAIMIISENEKGENLDDRFRVGDTIMMNTAKLVIIEILEGKHKEGEIIEKKY